MNFERYAQTFGICQTVAGALSLLSNNPWGLSTARC